MTEAPSRLPTPALCGGVKSLLVLLLVLAGNAGIAQTSGQEAKRSLEALVLDADVAVRVDGLLDEAFWAQAQLTSGFTQREPDELEPASERTEVRVAYSPSVLYIGIELFQSSANPLVAREMERDAQLYRDDSVVVLLDTFSDQRNGYAFETNPNGTRTDVLVSDEGRDLNPQWDGVWAVSSRVTERGWVVEYAIPFATLRFDPSRTTWGFNVRRMIRSRNEEVNWTPLDRSLGSPRDQERYAVYRVSQAGELTGLGGLRTSQQMEVKPFLVGSATNSRDDAADDENFEFGVDAKWGVTRSLNLDLTYNTDFAEVEVDTQQLNLTRFSLFFPEKREFFLENAGIFDFGIPQRNSFSPPLMKVFFSRRIGLNSGQRVPINVGARLTGRVGGWNIGVLDVLTEDAVVDDAAFGETNFSVIRLKRNLGRRSGIGIIATDRSESGATGNSVFGFDIDYKPTDRLSVIAFAATAQDDQEEGGDWSAGYLVDYRKGYLQASLEHQIVNEAFVPDGGFLLRRDFERFQPVVTWRPKIDRAGFRQLFFEFDLDYITQASTGQLESRVLAIAPFGGRTQRDDGFGLYYVRETENLFEPFEISDGVVIPAGLYTFESARIGGRSNAGRRVSVSGRVQSGDFFEGERDQLRLSVQLRASKFFRAETSWSYADVELPQGAFATTVVGQKFSFSFSPDLRLNAFVQYNDAADAVAANLRFNWIYRPGADLFVVYNHNWDTTGRSFSSRQTRDRQLIVKFTYRFNR